MTGARLFSHPDDLRDYLVGGLIPAVPVPFDSEKRLHRAAQQSYLRHMSAQPVAGVAVWAHTGRGLMLDDDTARVVLEDWRSALPAKVVIAGVGANAGSIPAKATP